jgi:hypothetical protein
MRFEVHPERYTYYYPYMGASPHAECGDLLTTLEERSSKSLSFRQEFFLSTCLLSQKGM